MFIKPGEKYKGSNGYTKDQNLSNYYFDFERIDTSLQYHTNYLKQWKSFTDDMKIMDMLQNKRLLEEDDEDYLRYKETDMEWFLYFKYDKLKFPSDRSDSARDDNLMFSKCHFTVCIPIKYYLFNANVEILKYKLDNIEFKFKQIQETKEIHCKNITQLDWLLNYDYITKISTGDNAYYMLYNAKFKMNWNNLMNVFKFDTCIVQFDACPYTTISIDNLNIYLCNYDKKQKKYMISCCLKIINCISEQQKYYVSESIFYFCKNDYIYINSKYRCINADNNKIYNFMCKYIKNKIDKFNETKIGETEVKLKYLNKNCLLEDPIIISIDIIDLCLLINNHIFDIKKTKDYKILDFLIRTYKYETGYNFLNFIENISNNSENICKENTFENVTKKCTRSCYLIFKYIIEKKYLISVGNDTKLIDCLKKIDKREYFMVRGNFLKISRDILKGKTYHDGKIVKDFIDCFKINEKWQEIKNNIIF